MNDKRKFEIVEKELKKVSGGNEATQFTAEMRPGCENTTTPEQNYDDYESIVRPHPKRKGS